MNKNIFSCDFLSKQSEEETEMSAPISVAHDGIGTIFYADKRHVYAKRKDDSKVFLTTKHLVSHYYCIFWNSSSKFWNSTPPLLPPPAADSTLTLIDGLCWYGIIKIYSKNIIFLQKTFLAIHTFGNTTGDQFSHIDFFHRLNFFKIPLSKIIKIVTTTERATREKKIKKSLFRLRSQWKEESYKSGTRWKGNPGSKAEANS